MIACQRQTAPVSQSFVTSLNIIVLFGILPRNDSLHIAKCFTNSIKKFRREVTSEMSKRSARKYTTFANKQLLRNCREQRPSNYSGLDWNVTAGAGRVYYNGMISCLCRITSLLLGTPVLTQFQTNLSVRVILMNNWIRDQWTDGLQYGRTAELWNSINRGKWNHGLYIHLLYDLPDAGWVSVFRLSFS
jgi:hypothetical protein